MIVYTALVLLGWVLGILTAIAVGYFTSKPSEPTSEDIPDAGELARLIVAELESQRTHHNG